MRPTRAGSITHFCAFRSRTESASSTIGTLKPNQRLSARSIGFLSHRPLETRRDEPDAIQSPGCGRVWRFSAVDEELQRVVDDQRELLGLAVTLENAADGGD